MMMVFRLISLIFLISACQSTDEDRQYYEGGVLKLQVATKDGKRNGKMVEYYQDGSIKAVSYWQDDLMNGSAEHFYPSGQKEAESDWVNGKRFGQVRGYYESGDLKFEGNYFDDHMVGENIFYFQSGITMEKQHYDSAGILSMYFKYDSLGNQRIDALKPFYTFDRDTIQMGDEITIGMRLGNRISDDLKVYIGKLPKDNSLGLIDTVNVLESQDYRFTYSFIPRKAGADSISGKMIHRLELDTLKHINEFTFTFKYYVRPLKSI